MIMVTSVIFVAFRIKTGEFRPINDCGRPLFPKFPYSSIVVSPSSRMSKTPKLLGRGNKGQCVTTINRLLMMSQKARSRIREEPVQLSEPDEGKMIKLAMQTLGEHYGMHRGRGRRAARVLGHQLGSDLAARFVSSDLTAVVEELSKFWKRNGIGEVAWHDKDNLELALRYTGESVDDKQMLCPFEEGLIEALLKKRLSEQVSVKEIQCAGKQEGLNCIFKITIS